MDEKVGNIADCRYARNRESISQEDQEKLWNAHVVVAGAGGLGGFLIEMLARAGIGRLTVVDGDRFEPSNLNRQLLCLPSLLGKSKAEVARDRVHALHPDITCTCIPDRLDMKGFAGLMGDVDLVADALGGLEAHLALMQACTLSEKPLVAGALAGWTGIVTTVLPGGPETEWLWQGNDQDDAEKRMGSLVPSAGLISSLQCAEILRCLTGNTPTLAGKLLVADLRTMGFDLVEL